MNPLDPELHQADDILAIYLIINEQAADGAPMSPGKTAAQAFQAAQRLLDAYRDGAGSDEQRASMRRWLNGGTRSIAKFAPTRHLFDRCARELDGITMVDEGLTEGTCGPTIHATWPLRRGQLPRMLRHKRLRLQPTTAQPQAAAA